MKTNKTTTIFKVLLTAWILAALPGCHIYHYRFVPFNSDREQTRTRVREELSKAELNPRDRTGQPDSQPDWFSLDQTKVTGGSGKDPVVVEVRYHERSGNTLVELKSSMEYGVLFPLAERASWKYFSPVSGSSPDRFLFDPVFRTGARVQNGNWDVNEDLMMRAGVRILRFGAGDPAKPGTQFGLGVLAGVGAEADPGGFGAKAGLTIQLDWMPVVVTPDGRRIMTGNRYMLELAMNGILFNHTRLEWELGFLSDPWGGLFARYGLDLDRKEQSYQVFGIQLGSMPILVGGTISLIALGIIGSL